MEAPGMMLYFDKRRALLDCDDALLAAMLRAALRYAESGAGPPGMPRGHPGWEGWGRRIKNTPRPGGVLISFRRGLSVPSVAAAGMPLLFAEGGDHGVVRLVEKVIGAPGAVLLVAHADAH